MVQINVIHEVHSEILHCFTDLENLSLQSSMEMCMVLSRASSPILLQSLVLMSFMLLKLRSTVAVVTGRTENIIANFDTLGKAAAMSP